MSRPLYRIFSVVLAVAFAAVGLLFLLLPDTVDGAAGGNRFFLALAGAYMFVVTVLAASMARWPDQPIYPLLLCQAKGASALLSLAFYLLQEPLPIYLANAVVDGALSLLALVMLRGIRG